MDSSNRVCWGLSGPDDPALETCTSCSEDVKKFVAVDTVFLQPAEYHPAIPFEQCNQTVMWNLTSGEDGSEVWRQDNSCGGIALSGESYKDFEFKGSFQRIKNDDDWIGFIFGFEDPGHFYLVIAPGVAPAHGKLKNENRLCSFHKKNISVLQHYKTYVFS